MTRERIKETIKNRTIFCRDNIDILQNMNDESIDLVYLDPPFNKKKTFHAPLGSRAEGASFRDTWYDEDIKKGYLTLIADLYPTLYEYLKGVEQIESRSHRNYLIYMAQRLIEIKRILKDTGSVYLHCDNTMSHYLKLLMDCVFGHHNFRNEIVWHYRRWTGKSKRFQRLHDTIFFYAKDKKVNFTFNELFTNYTEKSIYRKQYYHTRIKNDEVYETSINEDGVRENDVWHIPIINSQAKERVGYPTQKPIALLERIIQASSNKGDMVLDPFCGCATTCVAAEKLGREWIGIDVSKKAYDLVKMRLDKEVADKGDLTKYQNEVIYREDIPQRTDIKNIDLSYSKNKIEVKHLLYEEQEGRCKGCQSVFEYRHFDIDHIVPQVKGGGDNKENLQLLCHHCNIIKSKNSMEYLIKRLKELHIL